MSTSGPNKKYKKAKIKTSLTTNPDTSRPNTRNHVENKCSGPLCPLLAKDSEWVDILQSPASDAGNSSSRTAEEEEVLQLVECEDGPQMKPLAIMFPGILDKDPQTLHGMLSKAMSTTEVTKHLVDLGQKANFTFMKKANRLIPKDKKWLESLVENSDSRGSSDSGLLASSFSTDYDADNEIADDEIKTIPRNKRIRPGSTRQQKNPHSREKLTRTEQ